MAQQVVIAGAMFNDVPAISVPDANNVFHSFLDTTIASNAASASDIASGKLAYVNGSLVTGTASGGGGLEYESGIYTPVENIAQPTINFAGSHANRPIFVLLSDITDAVESSNTNLYFTIVNWYDCYGVPLWGATSNWYYARVQYGYKTSSSMTQGGNPINAYEPSPPTASSLNYYLDASWFKPYTGSTNRYWRSGCTYKWIAVWAPIS